MEKLLDAGRENGDRRGRQSLNPRRSRGSICFAIAILAVAGAAAASDDFRDISVVIGSVNRVLETERTGVPSRWSNAETGNHGTVTVTRTYYRSDGVPCREYLRTTEGSGGAKVTVTGVGCRTGPGAWKLDEDKPSSASAALPTAPRVSKPVPDVARPPLDPAPSAAGATPAPKQRPAVPPGDSDGKERRGEAARLEAKEKPSQPAAKAVPEPALPVNISASLPAKSEE